MMMAAHPAFHREFISQTFTHLWLLVMSLLVSVVLHSVSEGRRKKKVVVCCDAQRTYLLRTDPE